MTSVDNISLVFNFIAIVIALMAAVIAYRNYIVNKNDVESKEEKEIKQRYQNNQKLLDYVEKDDVNNLKIYRNSDDIFEYGNTKIRILLDKCIKENQHLDTYEDNKTTLKNYLKKVIDTDKSELNRIQNLKKRNVGK